MSIQELGISYATIGGCTVEAVRNFSIELEPASTTAIIGPSGCGKTSLLRAIGGLQLPSQGHISLRDSNGVPPRIGFMFQSPALLPHLSVKANVSLPMRIAKRKLSNSESTVDELLGAVGLEEFENAYPHELSGGMKARAQLARSLVHGPELLLMDEPFGSLDAITRTAMHEVFLNVVRRRSPTCLLVTHSAVEALLLSHRVIVVSARPAHPIRDIRVGFSWPRSLETRHCAGFSEQVANLEEELLHATSIGKDIKG